MTQLLELKPADHVLEVGTGSGYQCAILATLAAQVISIERIEALAAHAAATLDVLGFDNATVFVGDGTRGRAEFAPYDAIVVTAGGPCVPASLKAQLADGGRLVCPIGSHDTQELVRLTRRGDAFHEQRGTACVFVPLIGAEGWAQ
jgi:protein-L-isoaspartate(D-aspartate) O-methyltransferase